MDNGLSGVSHVCDDAIRQNQQDEVLLKLLDKKQKIISLVNLPKLLVLFRYKSVSGNSFMDFFKYKRAFIIAQRLCFPSKPRQLLIFPPL